MEPDFNTFLAGTVLNDGSIVSYRFLSREMKVHSNIAKQMLYDFHHKQNSKRPGSVHATYLVSGTTITTAIRSNSSQKAEDGEDTHMQSSPFVSSQLPEEDTEISALVELITLVQEENLDEAKARYDRISSIHIYSLSPSVVKNLQIISESNRTVSEKFVTEDPLIYGNKYGVIQNCGVKRRSARQTGTLNAPDIAFKPDVSQSSSSGTGKIKNAKDSEDPFFGHREATARPSMIKRERSDIFKSFSKPKTTFKRDNTGSSTESSLAPNAAPAFTQDGLKLQDDEHMKIDSEDEVEDGLISKSIDNTELKKSKAERAEKLRRLMDDEDDDTNSGLRTLAPPDRDSLSFGTSVSQKGLSPEPPAAITAGQRRGRRKVMKKKTIKDEEGYLVTKEEAAWESFSEEEAQLQKEKTPASTASSVGKGKKGMAKGGKGNIMNFFGKK